MHQMTEATRTTIEPAEIGVRQAPGARGATTWVPTPEAPNAPWWIVGDCTCPEDCCIDHENA